MSIFIPFSLPEDKTLKVEIRGFLTDVTEEEIKADLENRGLDVNLVKRSYFKTHHHLLNHLKEEHHGF